MMINAYKKLNVYWSRITNVIIKPFMIAAIWIKILVMILINSVITSNQKENAFLNKISVWMQKVIKNALIFHHLVYIYKSKDIVNKIKNINVKIKIKMNV